MLTFSPIALSLLTVHAPSCCSDLIGLELAVRPGGRDHCVSVHGAHLTCVAAPITTLSLAQEAASVSSRQSKS